MKRACFGLRLYPGTEAEYDRRHAAIWPELVAAIREAGIRNLSAFKRGTDVWHYAECDPDGATAFAKLGATNVNAKWGESLRPMVAADGERMWFGEIFHANGGGAGPFERGLFTLVVHPDRIAEYDERHAHPWPEMKEALDDAGFHNYTGFCRGPRGVYYGQLSPDMATAGPASGATDANQRGNVARGGLHPAIT